MILFSYVFTLAIALACAVLPLIAIAHGFGGFYSISLLIAGLVMAGTISWSVVPRRSKFEPPGVKLDLLEHPRLATLIEETASRLGERTPQEIYLILDANAWVTERGGAFGFGSRRIMAVGLPLLTTLTVSQLRSVLAHEFAHFFGGDTRLGPHFYTARAAMVRVLTNLDSSSAAMQWIKRFGFAALAHQLVSICLTANWKLFMRATLMIGRQQEFRSDELACYIAGPAATIDGLKQVRPVGLIMKHFCDSVLNPALSAGYRPPLADGFYRLSESPTISKARADLLASELAAPRATAYDTHPPLKLRLERAAKLAILFPEHHDASLAIMLLENAPAIEPSLLEKLTPNLTHSALQPMDWETAGMAVYVPLWRSSVHSYAPLLANVPLSAVPEFLSRLPAIAPRIQDPKGTLLIPEQRIARAANLVWMAFALQLLENGWILHMQPGEFYFSHGTTRIVPSAMIQSLRTGTLSAQSWREWCDTHQLSSIPLSPLVTVLK